MDSTTITSNLQQDSQRVLIIDDHYFIVRGLEAAVKQLGLVPIGVHDGKSALQMLKSTRFDLILLDIDLPDLHGKTLLQLIRMSYPDIPVLVISGSEDIAAIHWLIHNGAQGYINKAQDPSHTQTAINVLLEGGEYLPPDLQSAINVRRLAEASLAEHVKITPKQKEIILLVEQGLSNRDISQRLGIAEATVGTHMKKIFSRLKVNNRTQCAKVAKNLGVI